MLYHLIIRVNDMIMDCTKMRMIRWVCAVKWR